jgi:hypothetical protein
MPFFKNFVLFVLFVVKKFLGNERLWDIALRSAHRKAHEDLGQRFS